VEFVGLECVGYRLPTEIEWEYAARGGTREMTYAGTMDFSAETIAESLERMGRIARTAESSEATYGAWPCSTLDGMNASEQCGPGVVRSLESNAYGLYDMLGNVGEWTTDRAVERIADMSGWRCFGRGEVQSNGDRSCEVNTVVDRSLHADDAAPRVLRGGAFFHSAPGSRVSIRNGLRWERRFVDVGFRLARTASPPTD
jgi:formylglycine-generating enzyme required for sulfatase activity